MGGENMDDNRVIITKGKDKGMVGRYIYNYFDEDEQKTKAIVEFDYSYELSYNLDEIQPYPVDKR
jgi:hypothetical protein